MLVRLALPRVLAGLRLRSALLGRGIPTLRGRRRSVWRIQTSEPDVDGRDLVLNCIEDAFVRHTSPLPLRAQERVESPRYRTAAALSGEGSASWKTSFEIDRRLYLDAGSEKAGRAVGILVAPW